MCNIICIVWECKKLIFSSRAWHLYTCGINNHSAAHNFHVSLWCVVFAVCASCPSIGMRINMLKYISEKAFVWGFLYCKCGIIFGELVSSMEINNILFLFIFIYMWAVLCQYLSNINAITCIVAPGNKKLLLYRVLKYLTN